MSALTQHANCAAPSRLYSVRPSRPEDHPALADEAVEAQHCVTIHRIDGAKMILSRSWPWRDTDAWAGWRWRQAEHERDRTGSGA